MSQQLISRSEHSKLFLREYYFEQTTWVKIFRVVMGPLSILIGVLFYQRFAGYQSTYKIALIFRAFCFLCGFYYIFKPILAILLFWKYFKVIQFVVILRDLELEFQQAGVTSVVLFANYERIMQRGNYYLLELPRKTTTYLRIDQLTEEEKNILNKHLTA